MGRPRLDPPVAEQVSALLIELRARGFSFDGAWRRVMEVASSKRGAVVRLPSQTVDRRQWREALDATREEWRAAYECRPTPLSLVLDELADALDQSSSAVVAGAGVVRQVHVLPTISTRPPVRLDGEVRRAVLAESNARVFALSRERQRAFREVA